MLRKAQISDIKEIQKLLTHYASRGDMLSRSLSELYEAVRDLPLVSPHGHVDPQMLLDAHPLPDPDALIVTPDHYVTRLLHASGVPLEDLGVGQGPLDEAAARNVWRLLCTHWSVFRGTPVRYWLESELSELFDVTVRPSAETADEIYDQLVYGVPHACFPALPRARERTILLGGFSKDYAMTGWRIGFVAGPSELMEGLLRVHQFAVMCAPTMSQVAALAGLQLGCDVVVLERNNYSPAATLASHSIVGNWDNPEALLKLASQVDLVALENEFVEASSLRALEEGQQGTSALGADDKFPREQWEGSRDGIAGSSREAQEEIISAIGNSRCESWFRVVKAAELPAASAQYEPPSPRNTGSFPLKFFET